MPKIIGGVRQYEKSKKKLGRFKNFQWVVDSEVARSSQPGYWSSDKNNHYVKKSDITKLQQQGITCIISANSRNMSDLSQQRLRDAGIGFAHFKVKDFQAPEPAQLVEAAALIEHFAKSGAVLIYCGFGQGRTGTFVAAWALYKYWARTNFETNDKARQFKYLQALFGVEKKEQAKAINDGFGISKIPTFKYLVRSSPLTVAPLQLPDSRPSSTHTSMAAVASQPNNVRSSPLTVAPLQLPDSRPSSTHTSVAAVASQSNNLPENYKRFIPPPNHRPEPINVASGYTYYSRGDFPKCLPPGYPDNTNFF